MQESSLPVNSSTDSTPAQLPSGAWRHWWVRALLFVFHLALLVGAASLTPEDYFVQLCHRGAHSHLHPVLVVPSLVCKVAHMFNQILERLEGMEERINAEHQRESELMNEDKKPPVSSR